MRESRRVLTNLSDCGFDFHREAPTNSCGALTIPGEAFSKFVLCDR
jgi:hypothetical protein